MSEEALELPQCRWRGASPAEDRHLCSSPHIVCLNPAGVTGDFCRSCGRADHPVPTDPALLKRMNPPSLRQSLPCVHKGEEMGREECPTCRGRVQVKLFACDKHVACTEAKEVPGRACCRTCPDRKPDPGRLVAPLGCRDVPDRFVGRSQKKPWHYRVTVAIPTVGDTEQLELVVGLHRLQTVRPYLVVVDTGSDRRQLEALEELRDEDLEVHHVRAHAYTNSSGPVAAGMDLAFALCRTPYLLATHTDVFPTRRDALAWMLERCNKDQPVVGWEQSPRHDPRWKGCVSHSFTLFHMPTVRAAGVTWGFERYNDAVGWPEGVTVGFPDTEQPFNECLRRAGIVPLLLGTEPNFARHKTGLFDHPRSLTGMKTYEYDKGKMYRAASRYTAEAVRDARERLEAWKREAGHAR